MTQDTRSDDVRRSVQKWYDDFGWQCNASGLYNDTSLFSEVSNAGHGYYAMASHLSLLDRLSSGCLLLDAASGAIAHPEKLAYSWFYRYHVCVDISQVALREARAKLGGKGVCCRASITELPFRDGVFDGIVSAYTLQHIDKAHQAAAISELYRVLRPGRHLCIVSAVELSWQHRTLQLVVRAIRKMFKLLGLFRPALAKRARDMERLPGPPHKLYFCGQTVAWWRGIARSLTDSYSIEGFRLFEKNEFDFLFGESTRAARLARAAEVLFPRLTARMSAYVLIDLVKK